MCMSITYFEPALERSNHGTSHQVLYGFSFLTGRTFAFACLLSLLQHDVLLRLVGIGTRATNKTMHM